VIDQLELKKQLIYWKKIISASKSDQQKGSITTEGYHAGYKKIQSNHI
jgi:hypothetical protein